MRFLKNNLLALSLLSSLSFSLIAQTTPDATKLFTSSSDIQALIAKARSERKGNDPNVSEPILKLAPYNMNLEYRASVGPAAIHEREAEFLYVIQGTGTFVMGGKLVNETRLNAANLTGTAIEGGTTRSVAKGDYILVPPGTPHWFKAITSGTLVTMSMHVPRTEP